MVNLKWVLLYLLILFTFCVHCQRLFEDDLCKPGDNGWFCKKFTKCPYAQRLIRTGGRPKTCSFDGNEPIVCCPLSLKANGQPSSSVTPSRPSKPNGRSKAREMCEKYANYVYREELPPILLATGLGEVKPVRYDECARNSETLIVGGVNALPKEFPHMAQIGYGEWPEVDWWCGGSLISERFVLSAAHCTVTGSRYAKWARLGDLNIATNEDDAHPEVVRIEQRFNHPEYDSKKLYNDIALYKLERDIELNPYIRPLCLDLGDKDVQKAVATGWGHTRRAYAGSDALMKVSLNIVGTTKCNYSHWISDSKKLPDGIREDSLVCAGDQYGKDTCQGDSGGPLQIALEQPYCMYSQIGITSFGKECGEYAPGVYTRVSNYVNWIEGIVWP